MIPKQLKDCKFCKVMYKKKKPYEKEWTKKYYSYEEMEEYLSKNKANYGVLTGVNNLAVLDDDTKDKLLIEIYNLNFPKTFRVRDHNYLFLEGWDGKKIIFYHPTKKDEDGKPIHLGELQGLGQQVVGANSIHPSGEVYDLRNDLPIGIINIEKIKEVFSDFIKPERKKKEYIPRKIDSNDFLDRLKSNVSMEQVLSYFGVDTQKNPTNCIFHASKNNQCLGFNSEIAHCFNCNGAWNIFSFVKEAKKCNSAEAIEWLADFAGMQKEYEKSKEEYLNRNKEPMGWAKSINIKSMAERRNMLVCPNCKHNFEFNERLGWFKCKCSRGGIKKLISMF